MNPTKIAKYLRAVDYAAGVATLGYGVYVGKPLLVGLGVAGLVLAYFNLSDRISTRLRLYFSRKGPAQMAAPVALEVPSDVTRSPAEVGVPSYGANGLTVGPELYGTSRHSRFSSSRHLNHSS